MTKLSPSARRLRWRLQWRSILLLTALWVMISGWYTPISVVGGLLLSWAVTVLFPLPPLRFRGRLHPWGLVKLVGHTLGDLARASFTLARQALDPRFHPRSGIVRVRLRSDSDLYQVHTAELTSIVPGTVVVDARRRTRTLYLHVFDLSAQTPEGVRDATLRTEQQVLDAYASSAQLAAIARREGAT
jgi:multicomponent Na+:H+ antiporter subunit E